jgi:uncharacterized protein (DUF885 family)
VTAGDRPALDAFFESYYRLRPVNATFTGVHDHDARLPDWSPAGLEQMDAEMRAVRQAVRSESSPDVDVTLADSFLEIQLAELEGAHFQRRNPSLAIGEAVFSIISLITRDFAPAVARAENVAARLDAVPAFLRGARASLARAIPSEWVRRATRECEGARILLERGLTIWCREHQLADATRDRIARVAQLAARAVDDFAADLRARGLASDSAYGCGDEFLALLLERGHLVQREALDLLEDAVIALDDADAELTRVASAASPDGWRGVQELLAQAHPSAESFLDAFTRVWDECRRVSIEHDLVSWSDAPIRYGPIPPWTREAAPYLYYLFYRSPAPLDSVAVHDYVVTPPPDGPEAVERHWRTWNDSAIKLNHVVHHGALGHHLQNAFASRASSRVGRIAAVDCASRIGFFSGGTMAEGWACYATDLMDEVGFLTPLERAAEQASRVRMLVRAIVDVSLHTHTLNFEESVRFFHERTGAPPETARAEVVKASMFPGTASMYWLGTQGIHDLRREVARRRGPRFSLREFHDALLSFGSIPVPLAGRLMLNSTR